MNELFLTLGIERFKPLVSALLMPPVPFLAMILLGILVASRWRRVGSAMLAVGLAMTWLSCCVGTGNWLAPILLPLPAALSAERMAELKRDAGKHVAIIVLGSGVEEWAPEYRTSSLQFRSLERLRYGLWLGRRIGWPVGFSGGVGWGQTTNHSSAAEATVAQRIATEEYGRPLRWVESTSRDTRENAVNTVKLLSMQNVDHVVLVTHAWHMPRAMRNFERATGNRQMHVEAAPMGMASQTELTSLRWLPSGEGLAQVRLVIHEWLGMRAGA